MDIKKCFKILELDRGASIAEVKQAYKDIVNVWHPDRFSHNPRLKRKAEEKLKEINIAYEVLISFLSSKEAFGSGLKEAPPTHAEAEKKSQTGTRTGDTAAQQQVRRKNEKRDGTEAVAEAGTRVVLALWSYLSSRLRRIAEDQITKAQEKKETRASKPGSDMDEKGNPIG